MLYSDRKKLEKLRRRNYIFIACIVTLIVVHVRMRNDLLLQESQNFEYEIQVLDKENQISKLEKQITKLKEPKIKKVAKKIAIVEKKTKPKVVQVDTLKALQTDSLKRIDTLRLSKDSLIQPK